MHLPRRERESGEVKIIAAVVIIIVSHEWQVGEYISDSLTAREQAEEKRKE